MTSGGVLNLGSFVISRQRKMSLDSGSSESPKGLQIISSMRVFEKISQNQEVSSQSLGCTGAMVVV